MDELFVETDDPFFSYLYYNELKRSLMNNIEDVSEEISNKMNEGGKNPL
jgi:hypothetical protein